MKTGIVTIALAALGMVVFASSEAQGWFHPGPDMSLTLYGGNFITSTVDDAPTPLDGQALTAIQSGIAKGQRRRAQFFSQGLAGAPLSVTLVFTYADGSILSITTDDGSYFCTDGTVFSVSFGGDVTGRFEGATGTWEGTASSVSARVVAEVDIDLD